MVLKQCGQPYSANRMEKARVSRGCMTSVYFSQIEQKFCFFANWRALDFSDGSLNRVICEMASNLKTFFATEMNFFGTIASIGVNQSKSFSAWYTLKLIQYFRYSLIRFFLWISHLILWNLILYRPGIILEMWSLNATGNYSRNHTYLWNCMFELSSE
jgi:hypothetical protein